MWHTQLQVKFKFHSKENFKLEIVINEFKRVSHGAAHSVQSRFRNCCAAFQREWRCGFELSWKSVVNILQSEGVCAEQNIVYERWIVTSFLLTREVSGNDHQLDIYMISISYILNSKKVWWSFKIKNNSHFKITKFCSITVLGYTAGLCCP